MVKKQGSGAEFNVVSIQTARKRIRPPSDLNTEEARIFEHVVGSCAPSHFHESDEPLLTAYCTAVHLSRLYAEHAKHAGNDVVHKMFLHTAKLVAILTNRLRLGSRYSVNAVYVPPSGTTGVIAKGK